MNEHKIHIGLVDMRQANQITEEVKIITSYLRRQKLYKRNLLYRGFDGQRIDWVLECGSDLYPQPAIFCSTEQDLMGNGDDQSAIVFAGEYTKPTITVYDPSFLDKFSHYDDYEYKLKQGIDPLTAVIAILKLRYLQSQWLS